ncbi:MAG TPA: hypothetical protein VEX15_13355 [Nocardioidaceae bacterium]|nr:hypothetical protein [Nocardioidaceae bacterium]
MGTVINATAPHRWATLTSVLVGIIGLQWWLVPQTYPFGPGAGDPYPLAGLEAGGAAALAALLGVAGLVTAPALGRPLGPVGRPVALSAAIGQVVALGYVVPDLTAIVDLPHELTDGFANVGTGPLYVLGALAAGALWTVVVVRGVRDNRDRTRSDD